MGAGRSTTIGPFYYRQYPDGQRVDLIELGWEPLISSLIISGGCEEITLMDNDKRECKERSDDNGLYDLRNTNSDKFVSRVTSDLDNDVCKIKLIIKKEW